MRASVLELQTERLLLRQWRDDDKPAFAALNADPAVMEHFPSTLTRAESDAAVDRIQAAFAQRGWGLWAVEITETGSFAGFVGLSPVPDALPCAPGVEIGWRLAAAFWNRGYATEGARAALRAGFDTLGLEELVSFTTTTNLPSQRVMQKLGMIRDPADDFDHPNVTAGHRLQRHVLYRIRPGAQR